MCAGIYAVFMRRDVCSHRGGDMDPVFVGIGVLFFAISIWLISALEKL
jgi:hypothetical protein